MNNEYKNNLKSCERKVKYKTQAKAFNKNKELSKRGIIVDAVVYKCLVCGCWHRAHKSVGGFNRVNVLFKKIKRERNNEY